MISIKKIGSFDDVFIEVEMKKGEIQFQSKIYCSSEFLKNQITNLSNYISAYDIHTATPTFSFQLGAGAQYQPNQVPSIKFKIEKNGKFLIKISLLEMIRGSDKIFDQCELNFGADISSLDAFLKELNSFEILENCVAKLNTFEPIQVLQ